MKLRILIVEDDRDHSRAIDLTIANDERIKAGYEDVSLTLVGCASEAQALLAKATHPSPPYDILLLDLELPEIPGGPPNMKYGLELLRLSSEKRVATSVIVISQYTDRVRPAIQAWATGMVDKPYDPEELVGTILVSWERTKKELDSQAVRSESGSFAHFSLLPVRLFLSYARQDNDQVAPLYNNLKSMGFVPWMENKDLLPGQTKKFLIEREIKRADFVLICLSSNTIAKSGQLQREIREALGLWKEKHVNDIYLIPVLLEPCNEHESLEEFQPAYLYEEDGWEKLVRAIQEGMKGRLSDDQSQRL